jgi:nicotinamidase-related amidase
VLFDVLQAYIHPSDPQRAEVLAQRDLLGALERLLAAARSHNMTVLYTLARHAPDSADVVAHPTDTDMDLHPWPDGVAVPFRPGVKRDDPSARIADELAAGPDELVLPKQRWSAFFQTSLELNLRARGIDTIILAGLSTDVGIASTAFSARDRDFGIVVARDACWSHRPGNHDFFMDRVFPRMARVRSTDEIVSSMVAPTQTGL